MNIRPLTLVLSALLAFASPAFPADYPTHAIHLIVPYAPSGNADIMGRIVGQRLSEVLGQPVVIDNRPGANSIIGTELAAKAPPDGYTIIIVASSHSTNPVMVKQLPYDSVRDFSPIGLVGSTPVVLVTHPSLPASNLKGLIALARAHPGALNFSSSGNGSPGNLAGALLNSMAGINIVHVPYKGSVQATTDVIAGNVQMSYPSLTSIVSYLKIGKLKALGISSLKRSSLAPELPTISESGLPGYQASIWNGILAPANVPQPIVARLNSELVRMLNSQQVHERFASLGADVAPSSPEEFKAFIESEMVKWTKVIRDAKITVDIER